MLNWLKRIWSLRKRISTQMYLGIGSSLVLTIAASVVGWLSFNRVDAAQTQVAEVNLPEMISALRIAESTSTLTAAAPRLAAVGTPQELTAVSLEISQARQGFERQIETMQRDMGEVGEEEGFSDWLIRERFESILNNSQTLFANLNVIESTMPRIFDLNNRSEALRLELIDLRDRLEELVVPVIDDQLFYQLTGYQELGEPPAPTDEHMNRSEFIRYRHLSTLLSEATVATQLMSSAFTVSDVALVEPLRESFESATGHLTISMGALGETGSVAEIRPIINRLVEMGIREGDGFDLLAQRLELNSQQQILLAQNQDLALNLIGQVDRLVTGAEVDANTANTASTQAIGTGRTLLLVISGVGIAGALLISWGFVGRVLVRRIGRLSARMRRMAEGDLEAEVDVKGQDEVAEMANALEVFRRHALEVQRLNLVEKLAEELGDKNNQLEVVLEDLQRAQDQIVMREKLAALGQVTAGVAHEIRNPLNFIKNFSEVSEELIEELIEELETLDQNGGSGGGDGEDEEDPKEFIIEITQDLTDNLKRIRNHSERANRIVHDMLMMGRGGGEWRKVDLNNLLNEHALLAYHSARATDPNFNLTIERELDPEMGEIDAITQDLGRVFLNLVGNACYATDKKRQMIEEEEAPSEDGPYMPKVLLKTSREENKAVVVVRDNGTGIPQEVIEKVFNPFFTTKPTTEGTGLGLALTSDIVREHAGNIRVESEEGEFTAMIIELPLSKPELEAAGAEQPAEA